jgi:hypothetical protein
MMKYTHPENTVQTYEAKRRLKVLPTLWIEPDTLIPQAVLWPRHEAFLHSGHMKEVHVTPEQFEAAMDAAEPPLSERQQTRIRDYHGIGPSMGVTGQHRRPFTRTQVLKEAEDARIAAAQEEISAKQQEQESLTGPVPRKMKTPPRSVKASPPRVQVRRLGEPVARQPRKRTVKAQ